MQSSIATKWLALAAVAVATLLPGMPTVADSPYGFRPLPLWLAIFYLLGAVFVVLAFCLRVIHSIGMKSSAWRHIARFLVVLAAPALALLLALLPFALLVGARELLGSASWLNQWFLFNKYVEHFATKAVHSHVWLLVPAVPLAAWLYAAAHPGESRAAENAL